MPKYLLSAVCLLFVFSILASQASACQVVIELNTNQHRSNQNVSQAKVKDWPSFLGENRDGKSSATGILKDWSNGNLKVKWKIGSGEGYGIGSISNGRYFHFDRFEEQGRLRCLNLESGDLVWDFKFESNYEDTYGYDSGPRASPVIDEERVFLFGVEGKLICLNASDGSEVWSVDTSEKFGVIQNFFGVGSSPVVYQDKLLVMIGGSSGRAGKVSPTKMPEVKPANSLVVAFDKATGKVVYQTGNDLASYSSIKVVELGDNGTGKKVSVGLAWGRNRLIGFDLGSGRIRFEYPWRARILESVNASTPVVSGDKILLTECYGPGSVLLKWTASETADGEDELETIWSDERKRASSMMAHWNTPVLHQGFLYGSSGRNSGGAELRCVELATGAVKWRQKGFSRASVTFVDGHLIVLGEYGQLALVNASSEEYEEVTRLDSDQVKLTHPCWAAPIVGADALIVRGKKEVVCFSLNSDQK